MSAIRYKIGFTINAETLFTLASKLLPIDDFTMEETIERSAPDERPLITPRIPKLKLKHKPKAYTHRSSKGPNLTAGINKVIVEVLSSGMVRHTADISNALKAAGYSYNSSGSRLQHLLDHGIVEKLGAGVWRLTDPYLPPNATTEAGPVSR